MLPDLLDRLRRRSPAPSPIPEVQAPPIEPEPVAGPRVDVIRETIDLIEADLSAMIRGVEGAAAAVHQGASASVNALEAIRQRARRWRGSQTTPSATPASLRARPRSLPPPPPRSPVRSITPAR
jgi:hypothetical protein